MLLLQQATSLGAIGTQAKCPTFDPAHPPPPAPMPPTITFEGLVSLPWDTFWKESKKTAWDKHWWYSTWMKEAEPAAQKAIEYAKVFSKKHWDYWFGSSGEHRNMRMSDVVTRYKGKLVSSYGNLKAPPFDPHETGLEFAKRGGYLLFVDPNDGVFAGKRAFITQAKLVGTKRDGSRTEHNDPRFDLFMKYNPSKKKVQLQIRNDISVKDKALEYLGDFMTLLLKGGKGLCNVATSDKVALAASYASTLPSSAPYVIGWQQFASQCGYMWPKCPPMPVVTPTGPGKTPVAIVSLADSIVEAPTIPSQKWFETTSGKVGIATGVTAVAGGLLFAFLR